MSEFSAVANLEATVTQDSLRSARRTIERELGDVEVGVTANRPTGRTGGAVGARGPEPASLDVSRRQLGQQETLVDLAADRNDLLEEIAERSLGGGGGGGFRAAAGGAAAATAGGGVLGGLLGAAGGMAGLAAGGSLGFFALNALLFGGGELNQNRPTGISGPGDNPELPDRPPSDTTDETRSGPRIPGAPEGIMGDPSGDGNINPDLSGPGDNPPLPDQNINFDIRPNFDISADANEQRFRQVEQFVNDRIRQLRREIETQIGSGSGPRTTSRSGSAGGGGRGGPRFK